MDPWTHSRTLAATRGKRHRWSSYPSLRTRNWVRCRYRRQCRQDRNTSSDARNHSRGYGSNHQWEPTPTPTSRRRRRRRPLPHSSYLSCGSSPENHTLMSTWGSSPLFQSDPDSCTRNQWRSETPDLCSLKRVRERRRRLGARVPFPGAWASASTWRWRALHHHLSRKIARGGPGRYSSCLTPLSPWLPCRSRSSRPERSTWTASAPPAPQPHR